MDINAELRLSFYREIAILNEEHGVTLVQHVETKKVFVKKKLTIYDIRVFQHLMSCSIPGIPKIQELVETDGNLYVIEEYISGMSLCEKLDNIGHLPTATALSYIRQLCDILRPLHKLSPPIVHRDIKPSNIIVTSAGQLYLVDFNAAKETSDSKKRDTVLIGTFGYAAPEQYGFSASQPTTDIYALGVLLNEMLTGKKPQEEIPPGPLASVIKKCLQMEPSNRYQNIDQLLREIDIKSITPKTARVKVHEWFIPGFRSNKPSRWILAIIWYSFIVLVSSAAVVKEAGPTELTIFRIFYFIAFFVETLWIGNYRKLWSYFPLSRHPNYIIRVLGVACWAFVLLFAIVIIMAILTRNL